MNKACLIIFLCLIAVSGYAQTRISWEILKDVRFSNKFSKEVDAYYYYPKFGPSVLRLDGKEVIIKGFLLEIDPAEDIYVLSANPFSACFFCGEAGPESIIELKVPPDHPRFVMDEVMTFKGKFKLNAEDIYQCNYILEAATVVK
jgi:hypothetical protein